MKTKEEILCECSNLSNATIKRYSKSTLFTPEEAKKAMTEYAREACKSQRKICAMGFFEPSETVSIILNSKPPEGL